MPIEEWNDKKVLVIGAARTGIAVARFLHGRGAHVTVADTKSEKALGLEKVKEIEDMGVRLALGPHARELLSETDMIIVSPGVPHTIGFLTDAQAAGIPVLGEIELAGRYIEQPLVAVTGTNGKTTTTELVADMLRASGLQTYVGGNIGRPLIDYVAKGEKADVVVAEVSSYQLDTIETFRPHVGVLLNISEDHLDRYDGFEGYVRSKGRLFENQRLSDFAVINGADLLARRAFGGSRSTVLYFQNTPQDSHAWMEGDTLVCAFPGKEKVALDMSRFALEGDHNKENAAAAALAALAVGGRADGIQRALTSFKGLPHRMEYVRTHDGIRYFNDSKGTNVDAVVRALESFQGPIILIMGGRDKGGDYAPLQDLVTQRVKKIIVIGEAREIIRRAMAPVVSVDEAPTLQDAVTQASLEGRQGDTVLLSPGCSSFDMFTDYEERGEVFRKAVEGLRSK